MVQRNPNLAKLNSGYLFPEINRRKQAFLKKDPTAKLLSLGIGDTTCPLVESISMRLQVAAAGLGTLAGYSGYGPEQGIKELRSALAERWYHGILDADEIFISDGSKCDIGRLQMMFGPQASLAVQDPTYPVYVDTGVAIGQSGLYQPSHQHYAGITYMPCNPENQFFPELRDVPRTDLIYFCSPNNPTGAAATRQQLHELVQFAKKNNAILIYDAAYACYIRDPEIPRSIYEIEGAKEVAIELGSFSKMAGFTGLRLGWSVVPRSLKFDDGTPVQVDWNRINTTFFNGASNLAQQGGLAVLEPVGLAAIQETINYYMDNAAIIKEALDSMGIQSYGGEHAPYLWADFGKNSWEAFQEILEVAHVVTTPGSGFGPKGEGFLRFSSFGQRSDTIEAMRRIQSMRALSV